MTVVEVEYAAPRRSDIEIVAANMRHADRQEAEAMAAMGPLQALTKAVALSHESCVARVGGEPICIFGLGVGSLLGGMARPWLLGTSEVEMYGVTFLRSNRPVVKGWASRFDLENYVDARHTMSIRWLRWLGFEVDHPAPFGPFGFEFHRFSMARSATKCVS
jgi:hypothetical protein